MHTQRNRSMRIMVAVFTALPWIGTSAPLAAQTDAAQVVAIATGSTSSPEKMLVQRERANRLTLVGEWGAAGKEWARVARMQRAQGELPVEALRMQAEMYHVQGFRADAAAVLSQLGREAEAAARVGVGAQAFLEAAILYQQAQLEEDAQLNLKQVDRMLRSSDLDPELRSSLERRIVRE